jgi:hypothetical protein
MKRFVLLAFILPAWVVAVAACRPPTAEEYIQMVDAKPESERPPDWENTKRLMARKAPAVGEVAPDFTLQTRDGSRSITRSRFHEGRPLVLLFGSYT